MPNGRLSRRRRRGPRRPARGGRGQVYPCRPSAPQGRRRGREDRRPSTCRRPHQPDGRRRPLNQARREVGRADRPASARAGRPAGAVRADWPREHAICHTLYYSRQEGAGSGAPTARKHPPRPARARALRARGTPRNRPVHPCGRDGAGRPSCHWASKPTPIEQAHHRPNQGAACLIYQCLCMSGTDAHTGNSI